jgi:hypothetical protein
MPTHPHRDRCQDRACSPLEALEAAFCQLARGIRPVVLPAALLTGRPAAHRVPVDQVRARLAHPSCDGGTRSRIWSEVVVRARRDGEPWATVACAFAVPGLRRLLARLPRLSPVERMDVEQEMLTALVAELAVVDPHDALLVRRLLAAADRAGHRAVYRARTADRREAPHTVDPTEQADQAIGGPQEAWGSEYGVLRRAVDDRVISAAEAEVIARTRLHGVPLREVARQHGVSRRQLFRQRGAAEDRLGEELRDPSV